MDSDRLVPPLVHPLVPLAEGVEDPVEGSREHSEAGREESQERRWDSPLQALPQLHEPPRRPAQGQPGAPLL